MVRLPFIYRIHPQINYSVIAFEEWKRTFNLSLTMNYVAMTVAFLNIYEFIALSSLSRWWP